MSDGNTGKEGPLHFTPHKLRSDQSYISSIAFDPGNPAILYVSFSSFALKDSDSQVYRSIDNGVTWAGIQGSGSTALPNLPVNSILVDKRNSATLYAGTDFGIFVSFDQGMTWTKDVSGLPNAIVTALKQSASGGSLFAFTYGRGAWRFNLNNAASPCSYTLSPNKFHFDGSGGVGAISIQTDPGCPWSALASAPQIFIRSPASGTGPGTVEFGVAPSFGPQSSKIAIAGALVSIERDYTATVPTANNWTYSTAAVVPSVPYVAYLDLSRAEQRDTGTVHGCTNAVDGNSAWFLLQASDTAPIEINVQDNTYGSKGIPLVLSAYGPVNGDTAPGSLDEISCIAGQETHQILNMELPVQAGANYLIQVSVRAGFSPGNATILSIGHPPAATVE